MTFSKDLGGKKRERGFACAGVGPRTELSHQKFERRALTLGLDRLSLSHQAVIEKQERGSRNDRSCR